MPISENQKGKGWTILAVALTNKPRARQKGNPVKLAEIDGTQYLKVPMIRKSKISYKGNPLVFDQAVFDQVIENHQNEVWDSPPYVRIGHELTTHAPGLAWFGRVDDESPSGFIKQEGDWLVAYALPADEDVKKAIRGYKFASIDIHPDYSSNQLELVMSSDDFKPFKEAKMPEKSKDQDIVTLSKVEYDNLMSLVQSVPKLQEQIDSMTDKDDDAQRHDEKTIALEKELADARREIQFNRAEIYDTRLQALIAKAKARSDNGAVLSSFVLNTFESLLKFSPIGTDGQDEVIKLEADSGESGLVDYIFKACSFILENMPLTAVQTEGKTHHDETRPGSTLTFGRTADEMDQFYEEQANQSLNITPSEVKQ